VNPIIEHMMRTEPCPYKTAGDLAVRRRKMGGLAHRAIAPTLEQDTQYIATWHQLYGKAPPGMLDTLEDNDEEDWWEGK